MALLEDRFLDERLEPIGKDAGMHEHDGFAGAYDPILDFDSVECGSFEAAHPLPCG